MFEEALSRIDPVASAQARICVADEARLALSYSCMHLARILHRSYPIIRLKSRGIDDVVGSFSSDLMSDNLSYLGGAPFHRYTQY